MFFVFVGELSSPKDEIELRASLEQQATYSSPGRRPPGFL
jgi:hypothetical protein